MAVHDGVARAGGAGLEAGLELVEEVGIVEPGLLGERDQVVPAQLLAAGEDGGGGGGLECTQSRRLVQSKVVSG